MDASLRGLRRSQTRTRPCAALGRPGFRHFARLFRTATSTGPSDSSSVRGSRRRGPHRCRCRRYSGRGRELMHARLRSGTRTRSAHGVPVRGRATLWREPSCKIQENGSSQNLIFCDHQAGGRQRLTTQVSYPMAAGRIPRAGVESRLSAGVARPADEAHNVPPGWY